MLVLLAALFLNVQAPIPGDDGTVARSIVERVIPRWVVPCDVEGVRDVRVAFDIELDSDGRLIGQPVLVRPQTGAAYELVAENARRALLAAAPFRVPRGFRGGHYRPTFRADQVCGAA